MLFPFDVELVVLLFDGFEVAGVTAGVGVVLAGVDAGVEDLVLAGVEAGVVPAGVVQGVLGEGVTGVDEVLHTQPQAPVLIFWHVASTGATHLPMSA